MTGGSAPRRGLLLGTSIVLAVGLVTGVTALMAAVTDLSAARLDRAAITLLDRSETATFVMTAELFTPGGVPEEAGDQAFADLAQAAASYRPVQEGQLSGPGAAIVTDLLNQPELSLHQARQGAPDGVVELLDHLDLVGGEILAKISGPTLRKSPEVQDYLLAVSSYPGRDNVGQDLRTNAVTRLDHVAASLVSSAQGKTVTFAVLTGLLAVGMVLAAWRWWRTRPRGQEQEVKPAKERLVDQWQRFTGKNDDYDQLPEVEIIGPPGAGAASRPTPDRALVPLAAASTRRSKAPTPTKGVTDLASSLAEPVGTGAAAPGGVAAAASASPTADAPSRPTAFSPAKWSWPATAPDAKAVDLPKSAASLADGAVKPASQATSAATSAAVDTSWPTATGATKATADSTPTTASGATAEPLHPTPGVRPTAFSQLAPNQGARPPVDSELASASTGNPAHSTTGARPTAFSQLAPHQGARPPVDSELTSASTGSPAHPTTGARPTAFSQLAPHQGARPPVDSELASASTGSPAQPTTPSASQDRLRAAAASQFKPPASKPQPPASRPGFPGSVEHQPVAASNPSPPGIPPVARPTPWGTTALPVSAPLGAIQTPIAQVMSEALAQVSRPHQVRWSIRSQVALPAQLAPRLAQLVADLADAATAKNPALVVLVTVNTAGAVLYVTVSDRAAAGPDGPFGLGHRSRPINAVAERIGATLATRAGPGGRGTDVTIALPLPSEAPAGRQGTASASQIEAPSDPWHNLVPQARRSGSAGASSANFG